MALPNRAELEAEFGTSLDGIEALQVPAGSLTSLGMAAAAVGQRLLFEGGSPDQDQVRHEVAHAVQSLNGAAPAGSVSSPGDRSERDAEEAVSAIKRGEQPAPGTATGAVAGDWMDDLADWFGDVTNTREDEERLDAEEELASFMGRDFETEHFHPSSERGNFDASYNPSSGRLEISLGVFFNFRDGSPTNPDWVANTAAGDATFNAADFAWTDEEKLSFAETTISMVQSHWSRRYTFHCTRQFWEALPDVNVDIAISEAADAASAHYNIEVFKWPDDRVDGAHIDRPGLNHGSDHAGHQHDAGGDDDHVGGIFNESAEDSGGIASPDVSSFRRTTGTRGAYAQADTDNPTPIVFDKDSAAVSPAEQSRIDTFTTTMSDPAMPDFALTVTGRSSTEGSDAHNQSLSEDRAREVSNALVRGGVKSQPTVRGEGERGATEDPSWRRVDIDIGSFRAQQTTVLHEFGHIFGLGDEYPSADGGSREVGTAVAHSQLANDLGLAADPVVAHHSDSIMSNGEVVEPHHYATFLEVLGTMTDTTGEWSAGPGPGPALGPGDFNIATPGGPRLA